MSNHSELKQTVLNIKKQIAKNENLPFANGWATIPLKYAIIKKDGNKRWMSLMHPLSAINAYLFVECYEDILLINLEKGSKSSLRYPSRNNSLHYKQSVGSCSLYFQESNSYLSRKLLQQSGTYFKIGPYNSIVNFTQSKKWIILNNRFSYFAKTDYNLCFDSIYCHVYSWTQAKDTVDSVNSQNSNIYFAIDRLLQNVNGRLSHGVLVGPEFSRAIVELLVQRIDADAIANLNMKGFKFGIDYEFFHFVDDYFIFANGNDLVHLIVDILKNSAEKFWMHINDSKTKFYNTPIAFDGWLNDLLPVINKISDSFKRTETTSYFVENSSLLYRLRTFIYNIINNHPSYKHEIVSYTLGCIMNILIRKPSDLPLFEENPNSTSSALKLIRLILFFVSLSPNFDIIQKAISSIERILSEIKVNNPQLFRERLQMSINDFSSNLLHTSLMDISNYLLFLSDYHLQLPSYLETEVENAIFKEANPLMLAVWLLYSRNCKHMADRVASRIETEILSSLSQIREDSAFEDIAFWYILVFINCPYLSSDAKKNMGDTVTACKDHFQKIMKNEKPVLPSHRFAFLLCEFLLDNKSCRFFDWNIMNHQVARQIAFRTYKRTVFKGYGGKYAFSY